MTANPFRSKSARHSSIRGFLLFIALTIVIGEESVSQQLSVAAEQAIRKVIAQSGATIAVAAERLQTGERILVSEREMFHAASTMKTPVMIEIFRRVKEGSLRLEDSIAIRNEFLSIVDSSSYSMDLGEDSDDEVYKRVGQKMSVRDLVYQMITVSSNFATNILIGLVDARNVTQTMRELGAESIKVLRGVEDLKAYQLGLNNETNAYDLMVIMNAIGRGKAVDTPSSTQMVDILDDQKFGDMIPAQLPKDVRVAHKTGSITGVLHDSGLVFAPDGMSYSVVILSKGWKPNDKGKETVARISRMVYDAFTGVQTQNPPKIPTKPDY